MPRPKGKAVDGRFIRTRRENSMLTQDALAARCGLTRALVQKAERGGPLSPTSIAILANALGVSEGTLVVTEGWQSFAEERVMNPFKPGEASKVGDAWIQPRETLYHLEPRQLLIIALRSAARVLPAYSPRNPGGMAHLHRLIQGIKVARATLHDLLRKPGAAARQLTELSDLADDAYLAAGFARPAEYEDDPHAADAGFAVGIAVARVLDSLMLELYRGESRKSAAADHWRAIELATSACHASVHASIYLKVRTQFLRSATIDTHDVRNARRPAAVLIGPVWTGGQIPPALDLYMSRFIRLKYFEPASRITWSHWARKRFA